MALGSRRVRAPHALVCGFTLALVGMALRALGLRRTVRLATGFGRQPRGGAACAVDDLVRETVQRVGEAAAFYPGRAECLEQSLALMVLLRRRGVAAELRVGVQPFPFTAHAWVEHDGRPLNEVEDFVRELAPFPLVGG